MAEFSKQYCDIWDHDFPWDFDIDVIAKDLKKEHHYPIICEGFGFSVILKDKEGNVLLGFPNYSVIDGDIISYKEFLAQQIDQRNKTNKLSQNYIL